MATDRIIHGDEGDTYYVDENSRRCADTDCDKVLPLSWFSPTIRDAGTAVRLFCKACHPKYIKAEAEQKKTALATARVNTIRQMGDSLKKMLSRPVTRDDGPSVVEMATKTIAAIVDPITGKTGQDGFAEMVGREVGEVYKAPAADTRTRLLRQRWATTVMELQTAIAKLKEDQITIGDLDEDQIQALLEFASKQVILESSEIRMALLEDPEVRAALMADMNVLVVERQDEPE